MACPFLVSVVLALAGREHTTATAATRTLLVGGRWELQSRGEGRGGDLGASMQRGDLGGLLGQDQGDHGADDHVHPHGADRLG